MKRGLPYIVSALLMAGLFQPAAGVTLREADEAAAAGKHAAAVAKYTELIKRSARYPARRMTAYAGRAACLKQLGEYARAEADYDSAIFLADGENRAKLIINKSDLQLLTGAYAEAENALYSLESYLPLEAHRFANLSSAYLRMGKKDDALLMAVYVQEKNINPELVPVLNQNMGYILMSNPDPKYSRAAEYFRKALPGLQGHLRNTTLANLAVAEAESGEPTEALKHIDEALKGIKKMYGTSHPDYIICLRKRMEVLMRGGDRAKALSAAKTFIAAEREYAAKKMPDMSAQTRLDFWKMKKPLVSEVFRTEGADAEWLYDVALWRRHINLIQHNSESLSLNFTPTSKQVKSKLKPNEAAVEIVCYRDPEANDSVFAALIALPGKPVRYKKLWRQRELEGQRISDQTLSDRLGSYFEYNINTLYTDSAFARIVWDPILAEVPAQTDRLYFVPEGILNSLAMEYLPHERLANMEVRRLSTTARLLERGAKQKMDSALIVGGLDYYETAYSRYMADAQHDAADLLRERYPEGEWFFYLSGSWDEVEHIDTVLRMPHKTVTAYVEGNIKDDFHKYNLLHLSTHGYSLPREEWDFSPLSADSITEDRSLTASALALSGANYCYKLPYRPDELLSAREISRLDLSNMQLVVLSCCQSALGLINDEGPSGLVRGFKKAGAKTVMATLWSINDSSAAEFMKHFYDSLQAGKTPYYAAAEARKYLQTTLFPEVGYPYYYAPTETWYYIEPSLMYATPYHWAPFILIDAID